MVNGRYASMIPRADDFYVFDDPNMTHGTVRNNTGYMQYNLVNYHNFDGETYFLQ